MNRLSRVCVFCGASAGNRSEYIDAARALGTELARRQIALVYGGGSVGMMGAVARAVESQGGDVHGVIPEPLTSKEVSGDPIGHLEVVDSMHTRKARMAELADGFIALPGGFGTLEELFETITWVQLGIHRKPIGLLNTAGFFEPLRRMVDHQIEEGFIRPAYRHLLVVEPEPALLLERLSEHESPDGIVQWIKPEQT